MIIYKYISIYSSKNTLPRKSVFLIQNQIYLEYSFFKSNCRSQITFLEKRVPRSLRAQFFCLLNSLLFNSTRSYYKYFKVLKLTHVLSFDPFKSRLLHPNYAKTTAVYSDFKREILLCHFTIKPGSLKITLNNLFK